MGSCGMWHVVFCQQASAGQEAELVVLALALLCVLMERASEKKERGKDGLRKGGGGVKERER